MLTRKPPISVRRNSEIREVVSGQHEGFQDFEEGILRQERLREVNLRDLKYKQKEKKENERHSPDCFATGKKNVLRVSCSEMPLKAFFTTPHPSLEASSLILSLSFLLRMMIND